MDQAGDMIIIYTTFPSEKDARRVGAEIVEERLAACVNIFPGMIPIYRWQGKIETGSEVAMVIKTRKSLERAVLEAVQSRHPYSVPALLVFQPSHVAAPYLAWLFGETQADGATRAF
jgi:periplasmic divalent cation tolerance protein